MVERLLIRNFQSHQETDISLTKGVNIIIGSTDSGKSSIIRALRMLALNRPSGDSMRSWWGGETSVLVEFSEGNVVERVKGTNEIYRLNEDEFKAFRTNIPDEISKAVNLDDSNFQNQLDSPFLLSDTSGEVAAYFNRIAKIDKIDSSLKNVQSWLNQLIQTERYKQESLQEKQTEFEEYSYLSELEESIVDLEEMEGRVRQLGKQQRDLQDEVNQAETILNKIESFEQLIGLIDRVDNLLVVYGKLKTTNAEYQQLKDLCISHEQTQKTIDSKLSVLRADKWVGDTLGLINTRNALTTREKAIYGQITQFINTQVNLQQAKKEVLQYEFDFEKHFPDVCPLCGTPKQQ